MGMFHHKGYFHIENLSDKEYEPMAHAALSEFARTKKTIVDDVGGILPEDKNYILCNLLGYSRTKANKIIDNLQKHEEIEIDSSGTIIIKEFDFSKHFIVVNRDTLQYFYDTFGKDSLAFKAYLYLGSKWKIHTELGAYPEGFCFSISGASKMSLMRNIGYKSNSQPARDRLVESLDILVSEGLLKIYGPRRFYFEDRVMGHIYTLLSWKEVAEKTKKFFFEIPDDIFPRNNEQLHNENSVGPHREVTTERFAPYLPKFRNYYVDQDSPQYDFVHNLSALGEDTVLVLYHDMGDENLIKLLRDFPQQMGMDPGKIMFSTLSNQDDDVEDIWSVEAYD